MHLQKRGAWHKTKHPVLGDKSKSLTDSQIHSRDPEILERGISDFCQFARDSNEPILLIVDQTNALDAAVLDRVPENKKEQARSLLDGITFYHMKIASSTAKYKAAEHDRLRAVSEERISICLGLNRVISPPPIICT